MARNRSSTRRRRAGVTLLELLLALALSVIVLTAIGMAINLHFKMLDVRRTSLEEMQVVRAVTKRMTDDIRMMVQPNEPDLSGLETAFQNAMQAAASQTAAATSGTTTLGTGASASAQAGGGNAAGGSSGGSQGAATGAKGGQASGGQTQGAQSGQSSGGNAASKTGSGQSGQSSSGAASGQSGSAQAGGSTAASSASGSTTAQSGTTAATSGSSTTAATVVQLIGSATELRFDVSRIPRVDQYKGIVTAKGEPSAVDLPSDIKTIAYFLRSDASASSYADNPSAPGGEASTDGYGRGLMRAEMDRAVTTYGESGGASESIYSSAQLLADEVVGLGFEYWDGTEWPTDWDSSTQGLPRAIRIWLSIKPTYGMSEKELAQAAAGKEVPSVDFYFVVSLPTAPLVATPTTETTDTSGSTNSSTSQKTTSTTQGTTP